MNKRFFFANQEMLGSSASNQTCITLKLIKLTYQSTFTGANKVRNKAINVPKKKIE